MGHAGDSHDDEPFEEHHDDEGIDRPRGSPPDPMDRVWRHPTELGAVVSSRIPARARNMPGWAVSMLAGAAGALVTVAVLGAAGAFDRSSPTTGSATVASSGGSVRSVTAADVASDVGRSVVGVLAHNGQDVRRGSGVVVRHDGDVLTSARLVGDAKAVDVVTADGTPHRARVVGRDATTDLAVVSTDAELPAAQLATSSVGPGNSVWVVGAPSSGSSMPWMSTGLLSSADALVASPAGPTTSGLLETDAASNGWSSGGALVDRSGNVAGIVLSPVDNGRVTYAMPIAAAVAVANSLRTRGVVAHGSLGVEGTDTAFGPTIAQVVPHSGAAQAGLRANDVVTKIDGRSVASMAEVMAVVRHDPPGKTVVVELKRGNTALRIPVRLAGVTSSTTTAATG
jgi:S1-C subfamily serine protease